MRRTLTLHPLWLDDELGLREAVLRISGPGAMVAFAAEAGVQRVPPTERAGRRHTSTVAVTLLQEIRPEEAGLRARDLRIEPLRASGPGGQHRNKTETAIQIVHVPTGLMAVPAGERSQWQNRQQALAILPTRLRERGGGPPP